MPRSPRPRRECSPRSKCSRGRRCRGRRWSRGSRRRRGAPPPARPAGGTAAAPAVPLPAGAGVQHPAVEPWPGDRVEPFSKIRKITADHMIMSRRVSAHVTSFFEVDYSKIAELRRRHKASSTERGVNLTYLAFIAKACAEQLRQHPVVNTAVSRGHILYHPHLDN